MLSSEGRSSLFAERPRPKNVAGGLMDKDWGSALPFLSHVIFFVLICGRSLSVWKEGEGPCKIVSVERWARAHSQGENERFFEPKNSERKWRDVAKMAVAV